MIIYKTKNLINKKLYIGQDAFDNPSYLGSGKYLKNAVKKYGRENFQKETVAWCYTKEHLNFLEKFYIEFFNTKFPGGYNLTDGGEGILGMKHSEKTKKKMSESARGKVISSECREKLRTINMGKRHSTETKTKIGKASMGRPGSRGRVLSPEQKKKISEGVRLWRKNYTNKIIGMMGKFHSGETKKKMREAALKRREGL
jgi:group I intron endonuclease